MRPIAITEPGSADASCVRATVCLNRFELVADWGASRVHLAKQAHEELDRWLRQRMDLTSPSVYDSGNIGKGGDHG